MDIRLEESILKKYDYFLQTELKEHSNKGALAGFGQYNILAHLSTYFNNDIIVDIGTGHEAVSARAISYNKTNKVISYDTEFCESAKGHIDRLDNVEYKNINPLKDSAAQALMLTSPFISLDVDPHDGIQEQEFYDFFIKNNWKGIMVCDDIMLGLDNTELSDTTMAAFWNGVDKPKYDLTKTLYAHNTGTGIICFDDQKIYTSPISASDLEYREKQFDENMNWDNYGTYWQIDHILPQAAVPYDSLEHPNFQKCWALENLRPLEASENLSKGSLYKGERYTYEQERSKENIT